MCVCSSSVWKPSCSVFCIPVACCDLHERLCAVSTSPSLRPGWSLTAQASAAVTASAIAAEARSLWLQVTAHAVVSCCEPCWQQLQRTACCCIGISAERSLTASQPSCTLCHLWCLHTYRGTSCIMQCMSRCSGPWTAWHIVASAAYVGVRVRVCCWLGYEHFSCMCSLARLSVQLLFWTVHVCIVLIMLRVFICSYWMWWVLFCSVLFWVQWACCAVTMVWYAASVTNSMACGFWCDVRASQSWMCWCDLDRAQHALHGGTCSSPS